MRKVAPILLALLLMLNSFGLIIIYWGTMHAHEVEMRNYISSCKDVSQLPLLKFNPASVQLVGDDELVSDGNLYDIVRTEAGVNGLIYYAISDDDEDALWDSVARVAKNNTDNNKSQGKNVLPEVLKYLNCEPYTISLPVIYAQDDINFIIKDCCYQSPFGELFAPPPRVA